MPKKRQNRLSRYTLPERVRYLRQSRELSQAQLAKKAKVSQSTIAQIESGRKDPSISTLKKIAKALEVEIAILFASEDVLVFDLKKLRKKYNSPDKLHPTIYMALGKIIRYAKDIGFF
ncbi:MAG: XRE family transcriptional regulator [Bdellovibrio sp.]|nr:MAG: XRE family transcriptional regulator [Bdellovibrio sp.]